MRQLSPQQATALETIRQNKFTLIHGVTGSGKTEVYIQAAHEIISNGGQVIVLIPEISLTKQTVKRFSEHFQTVEMHSRLTPKQRKNNWQQIVENNVEMVIGARSALFAPLKKLKMIIIDEEHDGSYKQDNNPRYHARDAALKRAELENCKLILGSATPDICNYYDFSQKYVIAHLPDRVDNLPLPPVEVVDMRIELKDGNYSILSGSLHNKIADRIIKKEKTMLFLNRRGYASYVFCRECGYSFECTRCHVSLTYHSDNNTVRCHYCNHTEYVPENCPVCGSSKFKYSGTGTQKVEKELQKNFGNAKILRMDSDSTRKRGTHSEILDKFINEDYDILLGTQMITKGHDFPQVTLVGILLADSSLKMPDFRASERTFQLLTQVAGRTGRGKQGGEVVIQTYMPEHYSVICASKHDFNSFYQTELEIRKELSYPPFSKLILLIISSPDNKKAQEQAKIIAAKYPAENIMGPVPALISKIRGFYRWQILTRDLDINYDDIISIDQVKIEINVDPVNFY